MTDFRCNVCGATSVVVDGRLEREVPSCASCGSTVRFRAVAYLVAQAVTGAGVTLGELPARKDIVAVGLSDWSGYARPLEERLSYTNTFFHTEPLLDVTDPPPHLLGTCDLVIATEVLEHVPPPVSRGFAGLRALLKPGGTAIITVPYRLDGETVEHFPRLHRWRIVQADGRTRLENETRDGRLELYDDLVFHGGDGTTLEMRVFSRDSLLRELREAGFEDVRIRDEERPEFGIVWQERWSLPVTACAPSGAAMSRAVPPAS